MTNVLESAHSYPSNLSNFSANRALPRHRWFEFKEGYSSELVAIACGDQRSNRRIRLLDPFMGSGTALVSAGALGHSAMGIEVNPFLHFAARAKCSEPIGPKNKAHAVVERLINEPVRETVSPLEGLSTFTEGPDSEKWIFNRSVLRGYTALRGAIEKAGAFTRPLQLALLAALMDCSNVRRDGKCVRYLKDWQKLGRTSVDLHAAFALRASDIISDLAPSEFRSKGLEFRRGDCRKILKNLEAGSFSLFVTSPPYLNSFDYSDVYRPELFAGEFVRTNTELAGIRRQTIRSHVQVKRPYSDAVESVLLAPVLSALPSELWSKHIPGMIRSYFADMSLVFEELHRLIRRGGKGWMVVSTSAYGGVEVPVDLILADIAVKKGWALEGIYVLRQLRAAGQHWAHLERGAKPPLRESLIVVNRV